MFFIIRPLPQYVVNLQYVQTLYIIMIIHLNHVEKRAFYYMKFSRTNFARSYDYDYRIKWHQILKWFDYDHYNMKRFTDSWKKVNQFLQIFDLKFYLFHRIRYQLIKYQNECPMNLYFFFSNQQIFIQPVMLRFTNWRILGYLMYQ